MAKSLLSALSPMNQTPSSTVDRTGLCVTSPASNRLRPCRRCHFGPSVTAGTLSMRLAAMNAIVWTLACILLVGCNQTSQQLRRHELKGTQEERVARATTVLSKYCRFPGPLRDAHMAEDVADNSGGMVPGPSDSWLSGVLIVPAEDLPRWRAVFSSQLLQKPPLEFTSPIASPSWWPPREAFGSCEFYAPGKLTGRPGGFLAISPSECAIYFSTF